VVTDGDSEQAKGLGIKRAQGEICGMFCADNEIMEKDLFQRVHNLIKTRASAVYPSKYFYNKRDNSLNRYFALIGGNDPICYYIGKNDRESHVSSLNTFSIYQPSYGCNGFFYRSELIKATDLVHYYPMDNAMEVPGEFIAINSQAIWHKTSDNLLTFLKKRYIYARDLFCDRSDRRWKMLDTQQDYMRLCGFALCVITVLPCIITSFRGYRKVRDIAWFWHYPVCFGFLITYTALAIRNLFKHGKLFQCR